MIEVFSSGGGTQSAAIAGLIIKGRLPRPDFAVIADTKRETQKVWNYNDSVIAPALKSIGVDMLRLSADKYGYGKSNLFNKKGTLLIPAFSDLAGNGKLPNFCTTYWKIEVVENFLAREHKIKRSQAIAFVVDEMGWPCPPRSACFMCPNHTDSEWADSKKNDPAEFAESVRIDYLIREKDPNVFLHKSRKPLDEVSFSEENDLFNSVGCNSGNCFT